MICTVRVLYADTDQMGIANHAVALRWFEQARAEWLRQRGRPYKDIEAEGIIIPVYEVHVRYLKPSRYDDVLELHAHLAPPRPVRLFFHYRILRHADQALLISGTTRHACVSRTG